MSAHVNITDASRGKLTICRVSSYANGDETVCLHKSRLQPCECLHKATRAYEMRTWATEYED